MSEPDAPHADDPDFGPLVLVATEVWPREDGPAHRRRRWRHRTEGAFGFVIELVDRDLADIADSVRRDYRALATSARDLIEDVATRGHWRVGDPADAVESLRLRGLTVTHDRISVWLQQEPFNVGMIEVSVVDGAIVAIDYDP